MPHSQDINVNFHHFLSISETPQKPLAEKILRKTTTVNASRKPIETMSLEFQHSQSYEAVFISFNNVWCELRQV